MLKLKIHDRDVNSVAPPHTFCLIFNDHVYIARTCNSGNGSLTVLHPRFKRQIYLKRRILNAK